MSAKWDGSFVSASLNVLNFTVHVVCSQRAYWQFLSSGSGNGLVLNMWHAIIAWTNSDPVDWSADNNFKNI